MEKQYPINRMRRALGAGAMLAGTAALAACGGGSSDDGSGSLSLGVTDAPVDSARNVFVEFSSITLKPAEGEPFTVNFDEPRQIDLLDQQNGNSELLLENEQVAAGAYNWVRLGVNLDGSGDTYLVLDDGAEHELDIPSGRQTGLKLVSGFFVADGGSLDLTVDFDLRKSIVQVSTTEYRLKPALRLVNNADAGEIDVTVQGQYITDNCTDDNAQAVYVFEGAGIAPDDVDGIEPDPITTVRITNEDGDADYTGTAAFLEAGTYTVAFTCNPEDDDPEANDDDATFIHPDDVEVTAGETGEHNLPL